MGFAAIAAQPILRSLTQSLVPAELLRLARRALRQHNVDERGTREVHRVVEGAADVFRVFDEEALAAERLHHPIIARAVDQRVGLEIEERVVRNLWHAGADAAG